MANNNIYNINYTTLINWLIPPRLRNSFVIAWLKALVSPVRLLYQDFIRYKNDVEYRLRITPQVCYLEGLLNDYFDPDQQRITITDTLQNGVILIHQDSANIMLPIHQDGHDDANAPVIHKDSAYFDSGYDFNVNIPFQLNETNENRLKNLLNKYKLPGLNYQILYI